MDCLSVISLLCFQIVCLNISTIASNQKQQLADTLDRLLQFRGWLNINDRAIYQNAAGKIESFSGTDLYTFDLSEEYEKSMENRIVHVKNVDRKYDMVVKLLGCVYTKAVLTFLNLLYVVIVDCRRSKKRCRNTADKKVTRECERLEVLLTKKERSLAYKKLVNFENFKKGLDTAFGLLENRSLMLDFMSTALSYLIGLAPSEKMLYELIQDLQEIKTDINKIKIIPAYINFAISRDCTCDDDDKKYKKKLRILSSKVSLAININKGSPLVQFKNKHCMLPDIEQLKTDYRIEVNIIIEEMKKIENEVFTSFYQYLGFVYDNRTTILRPDNFQNVDNNNVNNSDSRAIDTFP